MTPHRSARLSVGFSCLGHTTMHVLAGLYLTVVLALEREWATSYDELIRLWTVGSLLIGLGAPLAGWLGDRWSDARMMVVFFLVTGAGAVAAGLADGPAALTLGLAGLGLGASIYHPVGMSWIVKTAENRGRAMGIVGIFGGLGVAGAAFVAGGLTELVDWRAAFWLPGAFSILAGVALAACIRLGWVVDAKGDARPQPKASRGDAIRVFVLLSVTMLCAGLIFNALQTVMPKWFELRLGGLVGEGTLGIGGLVTLVYLLATGSQLVGGMLADRFPLKTVYAVFLAVQVPLLAVAAGLAGVGLLGLAFVLVFLGNAQAPAESLLVARYTPERHRGLAFGAKFILAFGAAPLAIQIVALAYERTGGFHVLFLALASIAVAAAAAAVLLPSDRRAPVPVPVPGTAD